MKTLLMTITATTLLGLFSLHAQAGQICKVSMMGRVCFEEGSPEAAAHMKGDAVAEAAAKKKAAESGDKKVAEVSK